MLSDFYQQIQVIMTFLGWYDGVCDGVWGPKCIAAKRQWEFDDSFEPAVPSNGLPFTGRDRLPKGLTYMRGKNLEIVCMKMSAEEKEKILADKGNLITRAHLDEHFSVPEIQAKPMAKIADAPAPMVSSHIEAPIDVKPEEKPSEPEPEIETEQEEEENTSPVEEVKPVQNQNQKRDWTQQKRK